MKLNEIYPGLILNSIYIMEEGHSFRVWLWETQEDLVKWAETYSPNTRKGSFSNAIGLFSPNMYCPIHEPHSHLGEIHFVKDRWDEEVVAHEMTHMQFQYIRKCVEDFVRPLYQYYLEWMEWEEELCYPFGRSFKWVWKWLWKHNPNPNWKRDE